MDKKKIILITLAVIVLVASIFVGAKALNNKSDNDATAIQDGLSNVNYDEATEEEKTEADQNKDNLSDRIKEEESTANEPQDSATKKTVKPVITASGQNSVTNSIEVGSYVPGVFEEGGTCTTTLTKNGEAVKKDTTGNENVSNVSCGFAVFNRSELSAGQWVATVSYASDSAVGTSDPVNVQVN